MADQETKKQIKAVKTRSFAKGSQSLNPTLFPSQQIDKEFYEDLKEKADGFGLGSVLVEKLSIYEEGATLLDYFAGIAMRKELENMSRLSPTSAEDSAKRCYQFAEEMLKVRANTIRKMESEEQAEG